MRAIGAIVALMTLVPAAWAAPCPTTGGDNALHSAALGLGPGEWCKMSPNVEHGATVKQLLTTCITGNTNLIQNYAASMGWDPGNRRILFLGTPHGGAAGQIRYDASSNTWTAEEQIPPPVCTATSCSAGTPWNATLSACVGCDASHAYDSNAVDGDGNLWYEGFNTGYLHRFNGSSWARNYTRCPGGGGTAALVYWPTAGARGSLITVNGNQEVWRFDLASEVWSQLGNVSVQQNYHWQLEYHPTADQIWLQGGNGGPEHYRIWLNDGTPTLTRLGNAPTGRLGMTTSRCVTDPASDDTFLCWNIVEDTVGTSNTGWYAFDLSDNSWRSFASLGIASMPPLWSHRGDYGSTPVTHVAIPEYGVTVWLAQSTDENPDNGGMYVYRHSGAGTPVTKPPPPDNLQAR